MSKTARVLMVVAGMVATLGIPASVGAQAIPKTLTVPLAAQGNSGVAGTAVLTDMGNGQTQVVIRVSTGGNAVMPDHIHNGTCANLGDVKYPLNNVQNGTSTSTVAVSIADLLNGPGKPFAVNLHKSPQEASVYVSCGNVVLGATALPATGSPFGPALPGLAGTAVLVAGAAAVALRRRAA